MAEKTISLRWQIRSTKELNAAILEHLSRLEMPVPYSVFVRECVRKELEKNGIELSTDDIHP
jgi:hypothetical protein